MARTPPGMRWVPEGKFLMGSDAFRPEERPAHEATVSGFWMDAHPVTVREFGIFVAAMGYETAAERGEAAPGPLVFQPAPSHRHALRPAECWRTDGKGSWTAPGGAGSSVLGCEDDPVVQVSHRDAAAYAGWAGKSLPTEAEWERAARGGLDGTAYAWGDEDEAAAGSRVNTWQGDFPWQNLLSDGYFWTSPVGAFPPNRYGLYDLIGNVWEWTDDGWAGFPATPAACGAPVATSDGGDDQLKVVKGGSFLCSEACRHYRPAARFGQPATAAACHVGFRCVVRPAARR